MVFYLLIYLLMSRRLIMICPAAASQGVMGAGGTRTCAGRVGRRVSQGVGVPSIWNHDEEIVARATGRLTNWYPQVSKALGVASQENAVMPKKPGMSVWADQAQKKLTEQREREMPGMLVAKQKATQDAKDGKAERAAQRKEALQLREAEEVRGVQESMQMLALVVFTGPFIKKFPCNHFINK